MNDERWEYKVMKAPTSVWGTVEIETLTESLNKEGQQGWELVSVSLASSLHMCLFLKRRR